MAVANFTPAKLTNGGLIAFSTFDETFIAAAKALGCRFANVDGRKGWMIMDSAKFDAFRSICAEARERLVAPVATPAAIAKTQRTYATRGNGSVSATEYDNLRGTLGDDLARTMARQMQG